MKHILLATTTLAMSAGVAAADISTSATAKLSYGNFGDDHCRAGDTVDTDCSLAAESTNPAPEAAFGMEADVKFGLSGEDGGIAYAAGVEIDEDGKTQASEISFSTMGFTVSYDKNEYSGLTADATDGGTDDLGDAKISYAGNGLTFSYEIDEDIVDSNGYVANVGYTMAGLTVGFQSKDADGTGSTSDDPINKWSLSYTMGDITASYSADDRTGDARDWDASVVYAMGATTVTLHTDETEGSSVKVATTIEGMTVTARHEVDGKATGDSSESELALGYTMGDVALSLAYDTGNKDQFGDEAQTVVSATYTVGGVAVTAKANDQSEYEVSTGFTF